MTKIRILLLAAGLALGLGGVAATSQPAEAQIYFGIGNPGYGYGGAPYGYNRPYYAPRYYGQGFREPRPYYGRRCTLQRRVWSPRRGRYVTLATPRRVCRY